MNRHVRLLFEKVAARQQLSEVDLRDFALGYAIKQGSIPTDMEHAPVRSPGAPIELSLSDGSFDLDLARALAEVCAALCLAGELSLGAAMCANSFSRAHRVMARFRARGSRRRCGTERRIPEDHQ